MKVKKMHLFLLLVFIVLLACVVLLLLLRGCEPDRGEGGKLSVDKNAVDIGDGRPRGETPDIDSISIPGFERMIVPSGRTTVPCDIFNPEKNRCYFVAVIALANGTELYRSGLIPPGKAIYSISLSEPLSAGEYDATLTYECYALDEDQTQLNGATTHFILEVTP